MIPNKWYKNFPLEFPLKVFYELNNYQGHPNPELPLEINCSNNPILAKHLSFLINI